MKKIAYGINLISVIFVMGIGIQSMGIFSLEVAGILFLASSPYLYGSLLTKFVSKRKVIVLTTFVVSVLALALAIGGSYLLLDSMYIHPDAQSALAFVVILVYQWGLLLLSTIPIYLINKKGKEKYEH